MKERNHYYLMLALCLGDSYGLRKNNQPIIYFPESNNWHVLVVYVMFPLHEILS